MMTSIKGRVSSSTNGDDQKEKEEVSVSLVGWDLSHLSLTTNILLFTVITFCCWTLHGYFQELFFKVQKYPYFWFHTWIQFVMYSAFGALETGSIPSHKNLTAPVWSLVLITVLLIVSRGLGNTSFQYLDFTTKVLMTSSKAIPVLLMGIFFLKKKYAAKEYLATSMMIVGVFIFTRGDAASSSEFRIEGIVMALVSLLAEAGKASAQESALTKYGNTAQELAMQTNALGIMMLIPIISYYNEWTAGLQLLWSSWDLIQLQVLLLLVGYVASTGQMVLLKLTDGLYSTAVDSGRKLFSIMLSFIVFHKAFSYMHIIGGFLFFGGVMIQILHKFQQSKQKEKST